jgi:hypothetical protein
MGKENTIRTGTTTKKTHNGLSINSNSLSSLAPSSVFQYGVVAAVNPTTKEIIYNIIEDNVVVNHPGKALPLYKNKIQLPGIDYIVPLLRGPNTDISVNGGQYAKTAYYLDPIGIWQTVEQNKIEKTAYEFSNPPEDNVTNININKAEVGIPFNSPVLEQTTVDAAQRPLPSPSSVIIPTSITPQPSPAPQSPPLSNYTFKISLNYETWEADIYNNNVLIYTKKYVFVNYTQESIRENLVYEGKYFGFYDGHQFYPPQPDLV